MTQNLKNTDWFIQNRARFIGEFFLEESLARHTYYRIGGPAQIFLVPKGMPDLLWIAEGLYQSQLPLFILGRGSNLLVSDLGLRGVVVRVDQLNLELLEIEPGRLRTGGSVPIFSLLRKCGQLGWGGLEFWTGIPGLVGGAVRMNAGTHLGAAGDRLLKVEALNLLQWPQTSLDVFEGNALQLEYRKNCFLKPSHVVWAAEWRIDQGDPLQIRTLIQDTLTRRKATQPLEYPSCGSVFKNPKAAHLSSWQVIDQLGLRGHRIGNAQFSEKHPNFIVNLGQALSRDVYALIQLAKTRAQSELGILLEEEVVCLGQF